MMAASIMDDARIAAATARFSAIHAEDPRGADVGGARVPFAERYHARLEHWVRTLSPAEAGVALVLASRCQHLRRWAIPRSGYPAGPLGYKKWRSQLALAHADEASAILREVGLEDDVVDRVRRLLLKRGLGSDAEVQLF